METLPEGQRTAIELTKLKELSLKEAAGKSGMSVAALKVASHRAIKALRGMLKAEIDDEYPTPSSATSPARQRR